MLLKSILNYGLKKHGNYTIIVIRVNSSGQLVSSKPCTMCLEKMLAIGIRRVIYIDENSNFVETKTKKLIGNTKYSKGYRTYKK